MHIPVSNATPPSLVHLQQELADRGVKRLFVFGLATDYVVAQTVYNALGLSTFPEPVSQLIGGSVIVVDPGVRAIVSSVPLYENIATRDTSADSTIYGNYPDGYIVSASEPDRALRQYCSRGQGTCDTDDECDTAYSSSTRREYYCKTRRPELPWGECVSCPTGLDTTTICSGVGDCAAYCTAIAIVLGSSTNSSSGYCSTIEETSINTHTFSGVCVCDWYIFIYIYIYIY